MDVITHASGISKSTITKDPLFNQQFNNRFWREILAQVANLVSDELETKIEAISPFGFEVSQNKQFLSGQLRRFYCYLGVGKYSTYSKEYIATRFYENLYDYLTVLNTRILDDIVIVIFNQEMHLLNPKQYQCHSQDKLLDVQVREINHDLLTDYANYLITSMTGLHDKKIESTYFNENIRYRWRTYQLYVIHEYLFGYLLPPMTSEQASLFKKLFTLISNAINIFYHPEEMYIHASQDEMRIYEILINQRISQMILAVNHDRIDSIKISTQAYHYDQTLTLEINHSIYEKAIDFIKKSYRNFV